MKKVTAIVSILALSICSLTSCDDRNDPELGGKGGSATLRVTPQHHGENIDSCTISIKYNAQDKPANYDEEVKCVMENGKPVATFSNLKKGNYYVYGKGWDADIEQDVVGGIPYTITEEKSIDITVPVTEGQH